MAPTTPTGPPRQVVAGDSWRWKVADLSDYPQSEGWALKYELAGVSTTLSITPVWQTSGDDASSWLATVTTTETAALDAGTYTLISRVEGSGDYDGYDYTVDVETGEQIRSGYNHWLVTVTPDPRTAGAGDFQSHEERTLAVLTAAIEGRLTRDMESYSIAGRSISKIPVRDLTSLRSQYTWLVMQQKSGRMGITAEVYF